MKTDRLLPILFLTALAGSARADLVANGGFESGTFAGWMTQSASSGSFFSVRNNSPAGTHSGDYSAYFSATGPDDDQIWQTIPTVAHRQYVISFWANNLHDNSDHMSVKWEGVSILDQSPVLFPYQGWHEYTFSVTASRNGSELRFGLYDYFASVSIDDVSVTAVPLPSGAMLGFAGLAGLGVVLTRRAARATV